MTKFHPVFIQWTSANENGLKWIEIFSIRMHILNSEYIIK